MEKAISPHNVLIIGNLESKLAHYGAPVTIFVDKFYILCSLAMLY